VFSRETADILLRVSQSEYENSEADVMEMIERGRSVLSTNTAESSEEQPSCNESRRDLKGKAPIRVINPHSIAPVSSPTNVERVKSPRTLTDASWDEYASDFSPGSGDMHIARIYESGLITEHEGKRSAYGGSSHSHVRIYFIGCSGY
jgi:hypothetical protein